jgi:hypothetical protein
VIVVAPGISQERKAPAEENMMPKLLFVRRHPRISLAAALALILLIVFWPQSPTVPLYPNTHGLSYETLEQREPFRGCGSTGEENQFNRRITRFMTSDSPAAVVQFYTDALVSHGPYALMIHQHATLIEINRHQWISFEYETYIRSIVFSPSLAHGYRVFIDAAPEGDRTAVEVTEYQYERLARACHPW